MEVILASSLDSVGGVVWFILGLAIIAGVIFVIRKYKDKGVIGGWIKKQTGDND